MEPNDPQTLVVSIPYNRLDGSASVFDLLCPNQFQFDDGNNSAMGSPNMLLRTVDTIRGDVIWLAHSTPLAPTDWDLSHNPPEWVVHAVQSRNAAIPDFRPDMAVDRPECREWRPNPSYTLFKPADEPFRLDYIEVTLDQALFWFKRHLLQIPDILLRDLAQRKDRSVTIPAPRVEEEPASAAPILGIRNPQMDRPRAAARGDGEETERRVAEKLREAPRATSEEIANAIGGISPGRVRNTNAWKNRDTLKQQPTQKSVRDTPLTDEMLAVIDSGARDPAEIVAEQEERDGQEHSPEAMESLEVTQRRYIEGASSQERARFNRMTASDKEHELIAWKLTGTRGG